MALTVIFILYILVIISLGIISSFYTTSIKDYMLGGRSLSGPVAALGAGASDMSSWLLLAFPGLVMVHGVNQIWLPLGLILGAWLNWKFIAKRLRLYTEIAGDSITIPSFLENRFHNKNGLLRVISAIVILIFFTFYTSAGLVSGGLLFQSIFSVEYLVGVYITASVIVLYTCLGGFLAISWIDFFQGILMLFALIIMPLLLYNSMGGFNNIIDIIGNKSLSYLSIFDGVTYYTIISLISWGLGYFGQPHILVRFMATKSTSAIESAKLICMSWMTIALFGAFSIGFFSISLYFSQSIENPESIFLILSEKLFNPWISGILLSAVLSAIMSTASAQLLSSSSAVVEDFYHKKFRTKARNKELMFVSRVVVLLIAVIAVFIAKNHSNSIFNLVSYAWAGLGASFGPIILLSLFYKKTNTIGSIFGMISGTLVVILWPFLKELKGVFSLYELLPAFIFSCVVIMIVSTLTSQQNDKINTEYETMKKLL